MKTNGAPPSSEEGKRSAAGAPDPEVTAKATRRRFTAAYKLSVIEKAEQCEGPGEIGRLLRREGLYSSHLSGWRKAAREGSLRELGKKRGPDAFGREAGSEEGAEARAGERAAAGGTPQGAHRDRGPGKSCGAAGVEPRGREELLSAARGLAGHVGVSAACEALGVARATFYRRRRPKTGQRQSRPAPARALGEAERTEVFRVLCSPRFTDRAPAEVYATLLDEGVYLCSERTMYRVLAENRAVRERRAQRSHPNHPKPEIVARAPNEVWSWDITRLLGAGEVAVLLSLRHSGHLQPLRHGLDGGGPGDRGPGRRLIEETCLKQGVQPRVLTLHSDRGSPMTAKCTAQLLADLGVTQSLSRPRISNDNPYSEAHFKTVKYHPGFPGRFADIEEAKDFCRRFFPWYNLEHRHGGIGLLTPGQVHLGRAPEVIRQRQDVLAAAYAARPERFVAGPPRAAELKAEVWINRALPVSEVDGAEPGDGADGHGKEGSLN